MPWFSFRVKSMQSDWWSDVEKGSVGKEEEEEEEEEKGVDEVEEAIVRKKMQTDFDCICTRKYISNEKKITLP